MCEQTCRGDRSPETGRPVGSGEDQVDLNCVSSWVDPLTSYAETFELEARSVQEQATFHVVHEGP